jgi:two-component system response regulator DevR
LIALILNGINLDPVSNSAHPFGAPTQTATPAPLAFLVVEADVAERQLLARGLAAHGTADCVGTRAAARLAFRARSYDAMILDTCLPDGSGLDLIELALAKCPGLYVLVLTTSTARDVIDRTLETGAGYLLKPCHERHLAGVAREAWLRRTAAERRTKLTLSRWAADHDLSSTEVELLALGAQGVSRHEFSDRRNVRPDTIRKQIQMMLQKTGNDTFEGAVNSLLREALAEPT